MPSWTTWEGKEMRFFTWLILSYLNLIVKHRRSDILGDYRLSKDSLSSKLGEATWSQSRKDISE